MQLNRFWSSVGAGFAYLLAISLLTYLVMLILGLFFRVLPWVTPWVQQPAVAIVSIAGTIAYLDWRWGWRLEHIGMSWNGRSAFRLLLGLAAGVVAASLAHLFTWMLAPSGPLLPVNWGLPGFAVPALIGALGGAAAIEMVFRGAVVSRYEADLYDWEIVVAAVLTPFAWMLLQQIFLLGFFQTGVSNLWTAAMSVSLTMLFLRTDSTWLSIGVRAGMMGSLMLLPLRVSDAGALIVWGSAALILLGLEWLRRQRMPRRIGGRGPQRGTRGRTVRGPWGPH